MPALSNAKHELFAQALAKGKTQVEAYADAGYAPNDANANRLTGNDRVRARVAELLSKAAAKTETTVADLTKRLLAIADKTETSTEAPMLSVARATIMDVAKLNGLIIDKGELSGPNGAPIPISKIERVIVDPQHSNASGIQAAS